jgi:4'-phosphopantetheinyl transferase
VDVWLLREPAVEPLADRLGAEAMLTTGERARRDRLIRPDSRRRFLGARLLTRHALSRYVDVPPADWRFEAGRFGRPEIAGDVGGGLDFNVSHTDGLIACVVSRKRQAGVDTERSPARPEAVRLAGKVLTEQERRWLEALDEPYRGRLFSGYWVLKEAYTKALGLGLQRRFDSFHVFDDPPGRLALDDPSVSRYEGGNWQLELIDVPPRHLIGLAFRRQWFEPLLNVRVRDAVGEFGAAYDLGALPGLAQLAAVGGVRLSGLTGLVT